MAVDLYTRASEFTWLVLAVLDVARETDLDFDFPRFSTLDPRAGHLPLDGPGAYDARYLVKERLQAIGVTVSETRLSG